MAESKFILDNRHIILSVALAALSGCGQVKQGGIPGADERALAGELVLIPGGKFLMGDDDRDGWGDEMPAHRVTVPGFRLGKYEVTVGQFRRFVEATGYRTDAERDADQDTDEYAFEHVGCRIYSGSYIFGNTSGRSWRDDTIEEDQPVACVSWNDAQAFMKWLAEQTGKPYRLPTEAEWEYAARAGSTTEYSWGDDIGENRANCRGCGGEWDDEHRSAPVGSFPANAWGLHDMHGNVWEWVQDCWNDSYVGAPADGSAWKVGDCSRRVFRGGSWYFEPRALRSALRHWGDRYYISTGFRLAQDL